MRTSFDPSEFADVKLIDAADSLADHLGHILPHLEEAMEAIGGKMWHHDQRDAVLYRVSQEIIAEFVDEDHDIDHNPIVHLARFIVARARQSMVRRMAEHGIDA